ncbi:MAG: coproporphyrinogen III oxidase family protein [gamma proteobacterium symbiont of Bathyaustriella thionipta]|nr:coproporphyrinogen III oxidase family protein [gamma proteobacterium symbiont of Bathyaustriella thionipta]
MTVIERLLQTGLQRSFAKLMQFEMGLSPAIPEVTREKVPVLYIHIPFCESLCPFCSFHRVLLNHSKATAYFKALREELRIIADKGYQPDIIYVGGGTPTVLPHELAATLDLARALFPVRQLSVETNPNHLREDIFSILQSVGVDRLSVGIQSFDDALLKGMGRYETYGSGEQMRERLQWAQGQFTTLNADMIFNLPGQTEASLLRDMDILLHQIQVDQASVYPLMNSTHSSKAMQQSMGDYSLRNEKFFFDRIREQMAHDYQPSCVWCYSKNTTLADEYITADTAYISAGSGAFSYLGGVLYANTFAINRYARLINKKATAITASRALPLYQQARYDLLMGLFGLSFPVDDFRQKYDEQFFKLLWKEMLLLQMCGAVEKDARQIRLTRRGGILLGYYDARVLLGRK